MNCRFILSAVARIFQFQIDTAALLPVPPEKNLLLSANLSSMHPHHFVIKIPLPVAFIPFKAEKKGKNIFIALQSAK